MTIIILFWLITGAAALDGWTLLNWIMLTATSVLTLVVGYGAVYSKYKFTHSPRLLEVLGVLSIFVFFCTMVVKFGTLLGRHHPYW